MNIKDYTIAKKDLEKDLEKIEMEYNELKKRVASLLVIPHYEELIEFAKNIKKEERSMFNQKLRELPSNYYKNERETGAYYHVEINRQNQLIINCLPFFWKVKLDDLIDEGQRNLLIRHKLLEMKGNFYLKKDDNGFYQVDKKRELTRRPLSPSPFEKIENALFGIDTEEIKKSKEEERQQEINEFLEQLKQTVSILQSIKA